MLQEAFDAVKEFHVAKNIDFVQRLDELKPRNDMPQLLCIMKQHSHAALAQYLSFRESPECVVDLRLLRIHLILEEVGETIAAILECNEEETLDGICDSIYVLIGSAISLDLPLDAAFRAVQQSNMTKAASQGADNPRLKEKGDAWKPADIKQIISDHRQGSNV